MRILPNSKYKLMLRDDPVCTVEYSPSSAVIAAVNPIDNPELLPLKILRNERAEALDLSNWWQTRFAPRSRLPRTLHRSPEFARLFEASYGMSLSDQYWIKPIGSDASWKELNFFTNDFSETVGRDLLGTGSRSLLYESDDCRTPSITANGALRKYWRIDQETGVRQLCKSSSIVGKRESENEIAVSAAFKRLLDPADYVAYSPEVIDGRIWSVCDCFTDETHEYIPAVDALWEATSGQETFYKLAEFAEENDIAGFHRFMSKLLAVDALIGNQDRHFGNFGFIRNTETLEIEGMAPMFDCGTSLWCAASEHESYAPFSENINTQLESVSDFGWLDARKLYSAVFELETTLKELGVSEDEAERVGALAEYQADLIIDERGQRLKMCL